MTTKLDRFPLMYEEKPVSILVLPPINHTTAADAKDYYATTISGPLALRGFYVLPMEVTSDILKSQGIYDTETIVHQPVAKFRQYFGADAVLYTEINRWSTSYAVLAAHLTVGFHARLKSTTTERVLWEYSGVVVIDLTGHSNSGNPLADLIAGAIATSIAAAAADYVPYAMQVNAQILTTIPAGKYHPEFMADQAVAFVDQGGLPQSEPVRQMPIPAETPVAPVATSTAATPAFPTAVPTVTAVTPTPATETRAEHAKFKNRLGLEVVVDAGRILITSVAPESAAAQAGLQRGDQIVKYNGVPEGLNDQLQLSTIASAINNPLLDVATLTWRTAAGTGKTETLEW